MKKRKLLRNVSLVALSAVMMSGVALAATACGSGGGGGNPTTLTVNIFCNKSDEHTNNTICKNWEKTYSEKLGRQVKVDLKVSYDKSAYFESLKKSLNSGRNSIADVIYLSPKYVQSYADKAYVMDLSSYLVADGAGEAMQGIWSNAISYYGYKKDGNYKLGQQIEYREADGSNPAGFYTANGNTSVGVYGLPKDYSNFSMGYNKKYFSDVLKAEYQSRKGSDVRTVANAAALAAKGSSDKNFVDNFTGSAGSNNYVATYAVDGDYEVTLADGTKKTVTATEGEEAPIISIGVPVRYKPFNFYRYNDYQQALKAGDPIANAVETFTAGDGYTVTLPGFPGDTYTIDNTEYANTKNEAAPYDSTQVHVVYTYAEYGALVWAVSYYLNTFAWSNAGKNDAVTTSGTGGLTVGSQTSVIYGSEQYEGTQGNALYLLPWLASNDADFINSESTRCSNENATGDQSLNASQLAGDKSEKISKLNLDGTSRNADVQYGINSRNFIETYAAYQEFGSTWNGNSGNAGDNNDKSSSVSGWNYFRMGAAIFYGAGTWDAATRNDTVMDVFEFGQMPSPVSEKYALYSEVKDADYSLAPAVYSNDPAIAKGTNDGANDDSKQRANKSEGCVKPYTEKEIIANQIKRQDKWAARMDSVGYAANGRFADMKEDNDEYWKAAGAASLIQALTIGETEQVTLTYAGAQLPNFEEQCTEFLKFQDAQYANGSFKDMLTPEGFATTTDAKEGREIWNYYYENIARPMAQDSLNGSKNSQTVAQWIAQNGGSLNKYGEIKYDPQYANTQLKEFTGEGGTNIGFAMKVLRMVAFTYADRDLNIRMQYGLNSVRDATMYTASDTWLGLVDASSGGKMLAYINQRTLTEAERSNLGKTTSAGGVLARSMKDATDSKTKFWTPAVYCISQAGTAQQSLTKGN